MKNKILVDTTIWIEFFRGRSKIADRVESFLIENAVWVCGVVLYEVLQGIKSQDEKSKILNIFENLPYVEMTNVLWQSAAALSTILKKKGLNLPVSDILIAAIATENDLSVYTIDKHFEQIPGLKIYRP